MKGWPSCVFVIKPTYRFVLFRMPAGLAARDSMEHCPLQTVRTSTVVNTVDCDDRAGRCTERDILKYSDRHSIYIHI